MTRKFTHLFFVFVVFIIANNAFATDYYWDDEADHSFWKEPNNWKRFFIFLNRAYKNWNSQLIEQDSNRT